MTTTVTLLLFSGRQDPTWELTAGDAASLASLIKGLPSAIPVDTLGYRGFLVQSDDPALPRQCLVRDAPDVERFLLRTGVNDLPREVFEAAETAINSA
jgi:hypothetical protein